MNFREAGSKWWTQLLKLVGSVLLSLVLVGIVLLVYFNMPGPEPRSDVLYGITYSARYAEDLGLEPRATLRALLDDLTIRRLRIPIYWDLVEKQPGKYDFSGFDWQIAEARKRHAQVIVVVGERVPRWPECHIPSWALVDVAKREEALLAYVKAVIQHYAGDPTITVWQVENEPFLTFFGVCPPFDVTLLDREIALVRQLDPKRPILTTDSGELSLWLQAARRGDRFGTTMYRTIYKPGIGYVEYPLGPNFFLAKKALVEALTDQKHFMVIELQAEPWVSGWIPDVALEEQFRTMDEKKLLETVTYARRAQFAEVYLWGAEWWYWLKVKKNYPAVWEAARTIYAPVP